MATPYQSIDPALLALQTAKKAMPASPSTQQKKKPVLQSNMQQSQAPFATSPVAPAKIGGISSLFGATNINSSPILGGATPQEIGTTATQLQSLPKTMPDTGATPPDMTQSLKDLKATIPSMQSIDDIKGAFPEFSNLDDSVLLDLVETTKNSDNYEDILSVFPELQGGGIQEKGFLEGAINKAGDYIESSNNPLINNKLTRGYMSGLGTVAGIAEKAGEGFTQGVKTLGTGILGLANKFDKAIGILPEDSQNADILASKLGLGKVSDKSLSQDVLNVGEGTFSTAGNVLAPAVSFAFGIGAQTPGLNKVLEQVSYGFTKIGEIINKVPGLSNYRDSLPPEDQKRFDSLIGNGLLAFIGSKKGKLKEGDIKGYLDDNFGSIGAYDKAVLDNTKSLTPEGVNIKSNFLAKKLIGSKLKITDTNKKLVEKSSGVPATEFILNNDLGGASIDDMITKTQKLSDDAMTQKLQAFESIKQPQPITQREKLMANSIISQAKNDIGELYGKSFDEITPDEILPELQEQFNIVKNLEDLKASPETTAIKLQALQSLYDMYNSHLKYDMTKKRILGSQETIRLSMQKQLEDLGNTVGVDVKDLNKKIAGAKALEKGLIQAENRMDNNNMFGLSDTQTAILGAALGGGPIGVTLGLAGKSVLDNLGIRSGLASYLYKKPLSNEGNKIPVDPPIDRPTARANVSNQFGGNNTPVNSNKPNTPVKYPIKLQQEGMQVGGATLPKPTPKTPPITVEKGAIGMGTPKPKVTPVIPPKATVAPSVSAPKVDTFARMTELDSNPLYRKLGGGEILGGGKIKQGLFETPLGTITNEIMDGKVKKYVVNGKTYNLSDLGGIREKQAPEVVAQANKVSKAISDLKAIESGKGNIMGSSLRSVLDDLGIKDVNSIPEGTEQDILQMVRARKTVVPKKGMPKLGKEKLEQNLYHGTKYDFDTFDVKKSYSDRNNILGAGDAIYFSESKDIADKYTRANANEYLHKSVIDEVTDPVAKKLLKGLVNDGFEKGWQSLTKDEISLMNAKGIDGNDINDLSERIRGSQSVKKEGTNLLTMDNKIEMPDNILKIAKNLGIKTLPGKPRIMSVSLESNAKIKNIGQVSDIQKATAQAKKEGYDGVKFTTSNSIGGKPEIAVWNTSVIKKSLPLLPKKGMPKLGKETLEQNITQGDDYIMQEAKKYKSAEEFIKAQSKIGEASDSPLKYKEVIDLVDNEGTDLRPYLASNVEKNNPTRFEKMFTKYNNGNAPKDGKVEIYRVSVGDKINPGDWVTNSLEYANNHKDRILSNRGERGGAKISKMIVGIDELLDPQYGVGPVLENEFFYAPKDIRGKDLKQIREQANKKSLPPLPKKGLPKLGKETLEQNRYHGGTKKIDSFDISRAKEGNYGKGIYLTDNPKLAEYYGGLKIDNEALNNLPKGSLNFPERQKGIVSEFNIPKNIKIKELKTPPSKKEIEAIKNQGYDGVKFPDTLEKQDWNYRLLGDYQDGNTVFVFNTDKFNKKPLPPIPKKGK